MSEERHLWVWVVYDHPKDYPDHYVARPQRVDKQGLTQFDEGFASPDLENIRAYMQANGFMRIPRHPDDDPVILETWI